MGNQSSNSNNTLPIDTTFKLPADIPAWPQGGGFASGIIDLGSGLKVSQISTFNKVWTALEGGPDNAGATFFEPIVPEGFFMLGSYGQPNNKALFGWVLVAKQDDPNNNNGTLKRPLDYTLVWTSNSKKIKQQDNKDGYFWLPTPPDGYKALGHVVTTTPQKPPLAKIMCVRSDFTDQCEASTWIWGPGRSIDEKGFNVSYARPSIRGTEAPGVLAGTFVAQVGPTTTPLTAISCLKNNNNNGFSAMPNLPQIQALMKAYSPIMYLHPDEKYQSASVTWLFDNGGLLYKKDDPSKPVPIDSTGSNLPQGAADGGSYWIDLPAEEAKKERAKKGDFKATKGYVHVKPMFGGTFTDLAMWVFYPFNGPGVAKLGLINKVPLGKIGEHVGDWEHVTLRISNFNGILDKVYLSQHSNGQWVDSSEIEFQGGKSNKPVVYCSLNGHAFYPKAGLVLQGAGDIGIRNDTSKSELVVDFGDAFEVVAAEYLVGPGALVEPPWLNYSGQWGPQISYDLKEELDRLEKLFPLLKEIEDALPAELLGEEGPIGPKFGRSNWSGDEKTK